jgi:hypothetical protein
MAHPDPLDRTDATGAVIGVATGAATSAAIRTPFETRAAFHRQLQDGLGRAQREIWLADRDFADWPLNTDAFTAAMQSFLRQSAANHLKLLMQDAERLAVDAPRFMQVLKPHAQNAQCRIVPPHAARFGEACSMLIVDRSLLVRRFHRNHLRGAAEFDPAAARPWLDQFETLWEESTPALASTTLGLG